MNNEIERILKYLPNPIPESYIDFLEDSTLNPTTLLHPSQVNWEKIIRAFQREWQPLNNYLFPVEHLYNGVFACLHLRETGKNMPIVAWDMMADLGEQPFLYLAKNWDEYRKNNNDDEQNFKSELTLTFEMQKKHFDSELKRSLSDFDKMVNVFQREYSQKSKNDGMTFEHHEVMHAPIRSEDWKPERLAVEDILIGVMAYRFNRRENSIDVAGLATRDHTNFPRGSATKSLLTGLLCEWASKTAETIRFFHNVPENLKNTKLWTQYLPYEVALLGWILGVDLDKRDVCLKPKQIERLFTEITELPSATRERLIRKKTGSARVCLNIHRQIWSSLEVSLLEEWCPNAELIFSGEVDVGEQVRFLTLLLHARKAVLAGYAQRILQAQAEEGEHEDPEYEMINDNANFAYGFYIQPKFATEWVIRESGGLNKKKIAKDTSIIIIPFPDNSDKNYLERWRQQCVDQIKKWFAKHWQIIAIIPDKNDPELFFEDIMLVPADKDLLAIDMDILDRMNKSKRIHK